MGALLGWLGHTVADCFTHVDDVRPLFWALSDWTWASPVSYYGRQFFAINHGLMLLTMAALVVTRLRGRGEKRAAGTR